MKNKTYFEQIVSFNNLKLAFNNLKEKFYNPLNDTFALGKLARGIDGMSFAIFQKNLNKRLNLIQKELQNYKKPLPSIDYNIPKSSNPNKYRTISVSSLKEKVKHQAVNQIIEPVLESLYADNLYSYRKGLGAYQAIKDVRKLVLFNDEDFYTYKVDLKDYFDNLDHGIIIKLIDEIFEDKDLTKLIKVFLKQPRINGNEIIENSKGVPQGVSVSSHLANLYLLELDLEMKKRGMNYFRVGDDILILGKDAAEIKSQAQYIERYLVEERKLPINKEKTKLYELNEPFSYLGYEITGKKIRIDKGNCKKMKQKIRCALNKKLTKDIDLKTVDKNQLLKEIIELIFPENRLPNHIMWLRYFTLINDEKQLKEMDDYIEGRIRLLYFGKKRQKQAAILPRWLMRKHKYVSLTKVYFDITRGRKTFRDYINYYKAPVK